MERKNKNAIYRVISLDTSIEDRVNISPIVIYGEERKSPMFFLCG